MRRVACGTLALVGCFSEPPVLDAEGTTGAAHTTLSTLSGVTSATTSAPGSSTAAGSDGSSSSQGRTEGSSGSLGGSTSSTGDETQESGSTAGTQPDPYGDCHDGAVGKNPPLCMGSCVISEPTHSACAPDCDPGCDAGPEGSAASCLDDVADGVVALVCVLPCSGAGGLCPDGMDCSPTEYTAGGLTVWVCMWP